ncbi:GNAT family N-acetyltransferase [Ruegeria sp. THAF57]|uniref:GNAT family N-acetyltransferase n=1 Tax=Ruegeria sp. THAF57 TaxID=2744555 RepID=UPI0015E017C9|nr:GNAT family N-acetyltransferase [Ruegeria sp. THAF57]
MKSIELIYGVEQINLEKLSSSIQNEYWGETLTKDQVLASFQHSSCVSAFLGGDQIGFARAVSDRVTCSHIKDFLVFAEHRGRGVGRLLLHGLLDHPELKAVKSWYLGTKDAHDFYRPFGFKDSPDGINMFLHRN